MISNTKQRLEVGDGNGFLLWGYVTAITSFVVYAAFQYTLSPLVFWGFFLIPIIGAPLSYVLKRKRGKLLVTYTDRIISRTWQWCSIAFALMIAVFVLFHISVYIMAFILILCSFATTVTGIVIKDKWLTYAPLVSFTIGIIMFAQIISTGELHSEWVLIFGASYIFMMIIPGHLLNNKAKEECSQN